MTDKVNKLALDAVESSPETRSVSQAPSTTQTPTPPHSSSPISISSSQISSTDLPEIENENDQTISATKVAKSEKLESNVTHKLSKLTGKDSTQTKIPSNQVQTAVAPTIKPVYQDYSVPLKSEERCYSKKEVIVNGITYQRMDLIGRGGSSKVFKIMDPRKGHIYALKKVKLRGEDSSVTEGYYNEIDLLRRLKGNRHIIQLVDYEACKDSLLVVMIISVFIFNNTYRVPQKGSRVW